MLELILERKVTNMNMEIKGGYTKSENIIKVVNRLLDLRYDDSNSLKIKRAEVQCMLELGVINQDHADYIYSMFDRCVKGE